MAISVAQRRFLNGLDERFDFTRGPSEALSDLPTLHLEDFF
ncbi:hypothetical protein [Desulforamulus ruminis]|nr:hypothetical protein [Desulforamulus ruminis]